MDAQHVIEALHDAGLRLSLTPEQGLKVTPASGLTDELRDLIRASKATLVDWLIGGAANDAAAPWRVSVAPGTPPDALARLRAVSLALDKVQAAAQQGCSMVASGEVASKVSTETHGYERQGYGKVPGETAVRKEQVRRGNALWGCEPGAPEGWNSG